jgi:hypothetical protein
MNKKSILDLKITNTGHSKEKDKHIGFKLHIQII